MPRPEKKFHFLYKTTCVITNRYYIGVHSTNNLEDGYLGSGKRLRYSIRKHGKNNHIVEILEFHNNRIELFKRESEIVNSDLISEKNCMNLVLGGKGFMLDDHHYNCSKLGGLANGLKLKTDKDHFEKFSKCMSNTIKKTHREGKFKHHPTNLGKPHTQETKDKMSKKKIGKYSEKNNSQFGTCWITRDGLNKKIKNEQLSEFLTNGWKEGRSIGNGQLGKKKSEIHKINIKNSLKKFYDSDEGSLVKKKLSVSKKNLSS